MQELTYRDIQDNLVIIKINKLYSPDLSELELYEVTRGCWARKIESVQDAEYCLAVCNGEVVEVYKIDCWDKAGTSEYLTRSIEPENGRIEFTGAVASETIRKKYIGKSVKGLFKPGEADPVKVFLVNKDFGVDINTPLAPQRINTNGTVICGRCAYGFHRSERCPECGQLVLYGKGDIDTSALFEELCICETKKQLVETWERYGLRTTTKPIDSPTIDDKYLQMLDGSRIQISKTTIKLFTAEGILANDYFDEIRGAAKDVNDGSYRKLRVTMDKDEKAFAFLIRFFVNKGLA